MTELRSSGVVVNFVKKNVLGVAENFFNEKSSSNLKGYIVACRELGLDLVRVSEKKVYVECEGKRIGFINGLRPSLVTKDAAQLCKSKKRTLDTLHKKNVQAKDYFVSKKGLTSLEVKRLWAELDIKTPVVVKPTMASGGRGVTLGVDGLDSFIKAFRFAEEASIGRGMVLIEPFFNGLDVRVVVVGKKAVCSSVRLPAYIVGDGRSNAFELVRLKNERRKKHPHHRKFLIPEVGEALKDKILDKGEILLLSRVGNIHQGGESIDFTDKVSEKVLQRAESAVHSIPGLGCAGVDLLVNDKGDAKILEINTSSNFGIHYYPMFGLGRNPAFAVIREMLAKFSK